MEGLCENGDKQIVITLTILTGELPEQKLPLNSARILSELCTKNPGKYLQDEKGVVNSYTNNILVDEMGDNS